MYIYFSILLKIVQKNLFDEVLSNKISSVLSALTNCSVWLM